MSKKAISLTLEESNLLWLKARARADGKGSLSDAVDRLIAEARAGRLGAAAPARSVVGTIDLGEDPLLESADDHVRSLFTGSLARGLWVSEPRSGYGAPRKKRTRT
ncbi:MAG: hypothetical protein A3J29_02770 [Acidobacteria bacterium RIFCSPLOWO2_12_FULL_67_14b]|nr:MAG: hypothetical protein A3J29_02770 [Acidobacteria bacterium RIFCSPLOWO2_12_FULL_67_14b]